MLNSRRSYIKYLQCTSAHTAVGVLTRVRKRATRRAPHAGVETRERNLSQELVTRSDRTNTCCSVSLHNPQQATEGRVRERGRVGACVRIAWGGRATSLCVLPSLDRTKLGSSIISASQTASSFNPPAPQAFSERLIFLNAA